MDQFFSNINFGDISPWLLLVVYIILTKWTSFTSGIKSLFSAWVAGRRARANERRQYNDELISIIREAMHWSRAEFSEMERKVDFIQIQVLRLVDLFTLLNSQITEIIDFIHQKRADD